MKPPKYVLLQGLSAGNKFFTGFTEGKDPTLLADGTKAYLVLGYSNSICGAQTMLGHYPELGWLCTGCQYEDNCNQADTDGPSAAFAWEWLCTKPWLCVCYDDEKCQWGVLSQAGDCDDGWRSHADDPLKAVLELIRKCKDTGVTP